MLYAHVLYICVYILLFNFPYQLCFIYILKKCKKLLALKISFKNKNNKLRYRIINNYLIVCNIYSTIRITHRHLLQHLIETFFF